MAKRPGGIVAVFEYLDYLIDAIDKAKTRGDFGGYEVYSPTSYHEIEHACDFGSSDVKWFTLAGGLIGTFSGFFLCLICDWDWNLIVGGKMGGIPSLPAYVVIGFELTILLGGIMTIIGMLILCKLPNPKVRILDKRFTDNRFGIFVPNATDDGEQARLLKECGAEEVRVVEA